MSVASKNPFALLDEDPSSSPSVSAAPAKEAAPAPAASTRGTQKARSGPASRGGKYYPRGGKTSTPRENQNGEAGADEPSEPRKRFDGEGRGRGRGRGRGDRGGRGGRGRPFDRHSATGKTDSDKKLHQGWGGDEGSSELKAENAAVTDAQAEASTPAGEAWDAPTTGDWAAPAEGAEGAAAAEGEKAESRRREVEEEDNTLTLDEYLKTQKGLDIVPKLETRKANEGDDSIWKDAVVVTKKDEEETAYFVGKGKAAPKARAKKEEKVFIEIDARFERPSRGRGGRGGDRGGDRSDRGDRPRGGRGRGARGRGANGGSTAALNVDDQTAFPSLS